MKKLLSAAPLALLIAGLAAWPGTAQAATANVTFVPPAQFTDNSALAWAQITAIQLIDTSKLTPGDIGTVIVTFTPPTTAPAAGASVSVTGAVPAQFINNPPAADSYVLRIMTAPGAGQASTPITATIPLAVAKAPGSWTLTFTNP